MTKQAEPENRDDKEMPEPRPEDEEAEESAAERRNRGLLP
jgi:hypothetical protein